jgi:hypothetical protein
MEIIKIPVLFKKKDKITRAELSSPVFIRRFRKITESNY